MNLKVKLIICFLLVGFIPFGVSSLLSTKSSSDSLVEGVHDKLNSSGTIKHHQLEGLFSRWYSNASMISKSRKLQDIFVSADSKSWSSVLKYQNYFENILKEALFEDILFVSNEGKIIGAVKNRKLTGTSFEQFKGLPVYDALKKSNTMGYKSIDSVQYANFEKYSSFNNEQASFLVSKFAPNSKDRGRWKKGESIGFLVYKISEKEIDKVVNEREGMGKTGETYLVSKKSNGETIYASNRVVKNGPVGKAKKGSTISKLFDSKKDFNLVKVGSTGVTEIVHAKYFKFKNTEIGMFTTQSQDEALESVSDLKKLMFVLAIVFGTLIFLFSTLIANKISKPILSITEELFANADGVSTASKVVADSSSKLSQASLQQAAGLQETVSSVDEISAMIDRNTEASNDSKKVSEISRDVAVQGKETIEKMIVAINEINASNSQISGEMTESNERIRDIVKLIQEIGDKTQVINDIVFQTKLLSFNASVEAARAGEHGKGFAVVAEEVGNLANMSGKAAEEISFMLEGSIKTAEDIITTTTQKVEGLIVIGKETVERGSVLASECGTALDQIVQNVSQVNGQVSEIATASVEQSQGVREINDAVKQMDEVTNMNSQVSNEANEQANILEEQSKSLYGEVVKLVELVTGDSKNKNRAA